MRHTAYFPLRTVIPIRPSLRCNSIFVLVWLVLGISVAIPGARAQSTTTARLVLTDDAGNEVFNFETGQDAFVWLEDEDSNADPGTAEELTARIWSDSQPEGQTVTLMETANSSDTFTAEIDLSFATEGDRLMVEYIDPADSFGNMRAVRDDAYYAVSVASGVIAQDTTWTVDASPIVVTGDVRVEAGSTLTIEPGVEVRFRQLQDELATGTDTLRLEINVLGGLIARGTEADSIVFTSDGLAPERGDWFGLFVGDSLATLELEYGRVEYARYGVFLESFFDTPADTLSIANSRFRELSEAAVHSRYSRRHFILENNLVQDAGSGVRVEVGYREASGSITGNRIHRTSGPGISLDRAAWFEVRRNEIADNEGVGLHAYRVDSLFVRDTFLQENEGGIYLKEVADARLSANEIRGSRAWGLQLDRTRAVADSNIVSGNATAGWAGGIYVFTDLQFPVTDSLLYNTVSDNGGEGIHNDGRAQTVSRFNNVFDNIEYDFRNTSAVWDELDARLNWWGSETTLEISELGFNPKNLQRLYDAFDDPSLGLVNYSGWLLEEYVHEDSIRLARPSAGEVWRAGTSEIIVWSPSPTDSVTLRLDLRAPNGEITRLTDALPDDDRSWVWPIPQQLEGGIAYEILLSDDVTGRLIDTSGEFTILPASANRLVSLQEGWNLVGLPLGTSSRSLGALFPAADAGSLTGFDGGFETLDGDELQLGRGYWVRSSSSDSLLLVGLETWSAGVRLERGWNLISGPNCGGRGSTIGDMTAEVIPGTLYGYSDTYEPAGRLESGKGYWIQASKAGTAWLSCSQSNEPPEPIRPAFFDGDRLEVTSASGATRSLYFGAETGSLDPRSLELPPLPDAGFLDIRFVDGTLAKSPGAELGAVDLTLGLDPVAMTWISSTDSALRLQLGPEDRLLLPGEGIQISESTRFMAAVEAAPVVLPDAFGLEGNFPNPFTSSTNVRVLLPEARTVQIRVYDLIGREILRRVSDEVAGDVSIPVDATGLAAGVYLYTVETGDWRAIGRFVVAR